MGTSPEARPRCPCGADFRGLIGHRVADLGRQPYDRGNRLDRLDSRAGPVRARHHGETEVARTQAAEPVPWSEFQRLPASLVRPRCRGFSRVFSA